MIQYIQNAHFGARQMTNTPKYFFDCFVDDMLSDRSPI